MMRGRMRLKTVRVAVSGPVRLSLNGCWAEKPAASQVPN